MARRRAVLPCARTSARLSARMPASTWLSRITLYNIAPNAPRRPVSPPGR